MSIIQSPVVLHLHGVSNTEVAVFAWLNSLTTYHHPNINEKYIHKEQVISNFAGLVRVYNHIGS